MRENRSVGFQNRPYTDQSVQLQSLVKKKNLKFQTEKEKASNYLFGENKGADLLAVTVQLICVFVKMHMQNAGFLIMRHILLQKRLLKVKKLSTCKQVV